jgi:Circadian oscillating protein COP23
MKSNLFKGINILTIVSTLVGIVGLYIAFLNRWPPFLVQQTDRFSCELLSYPNEGEVWTVMYRNDKQKAPWLKIAASMGSNWTPAQRCQEISQRLENYRQDGLTQLTYRSDPNTPKQFVICAKTKVGGDNCPLLVTLKPDSNPYLSLSYMTAKLTAEANNNTDSQPKIDISFSNKGSGNKPIVINGREPLMPLIIELEKHLADEDRKSGK